MFTRRVASVTSLLPQAEKEFARPPNVPVPKVRRETFKPECPGLSEFHKALVPFCMRADSIEGRVPQNFIRLPYLSMLARIALALSACAPILSCRKYCRSSVAAEFVSFRPR
jgi:hypothetical protein